MEASVLRGLLPAVTDAASEYLLPAHAIFDDVRRHGGQLSCAFLTGPASVWEIRQRFCGGLKAPRDTIGVTWIVPLDISMNGGELTERLLGPLYFRLNHSAGGGPASGVPQVFSHFATSE